MPSATCRRAPSLPVRAQALMTTDAPRSQMMAVNRSMREKYGAGSAAQYGGPGYVQGSVPL